MRSPAITTVMSGSADLPVASITVTCVIASGRGAGPVLTCEIAVTNARQRIKLAKANVRIIGRLGLSSRFGLVNNTACQRNDITVASSQQGKLFRALIFLVLGGRARPTPP